MQTHTTCRLTRRATLATAAILAFTPNARAIDTGLPTAPRALMAQDADHTPPRELIERGDLTLAQRQLDRALEAERTADALSARARVHFLLSELDAADRLANEALALDPRCQEALATRAMSLATRKQPDEALAMAQRALALDADNRWAQNAHARALFAAGQHAEALVVYERVLAAAPRDSFALYGKAMSLLVQGDKEGAEAFLTHMIEHSAEPGFGLWSRARVRIELNKIDGALADFAAAVEASPDDLKYRYDYASVLFQLRRFDAMNDVIDVALQIDPDQSLFLCLRGQALELDGDIRGAMREYNLAAEAEPDDDYPHQRMAYVYRDHLRDYERCIAAWDRAIERSDAPADYYYRRGHAHRTFGQHQAGLDDFTAAIDHDDTHVMAWASIAEMIQPREALPIYLRLCELDPQRADWPSHAAIIYANAGDPRRAAELYTQSLEIDPDYFYARRNRGQMYNNLGLPEDAIADHTYIIDNCEDRAWVARAYFDRGNAYSACEEHALAEADFKTTIRMGNTMPAASYNLGLTYQRRGMWDEAVEAYSVAIRQFPEYANALGNRAVCRDSLGAYEDGLADIEKAIALSRRTTDWHHEVQSRLLNKLGRYEAAIAATDQALRRNPENSRAWQNRLTALLHLDREDEAEHAAQERSKIEQPGYACFAIAQCYATAERMDAAVGWLEHSLARDIPTPDWSYQVLTIVHLARGDFDAAQAVGKQFLVLDPDVPDAYLYLALIERAKGNETESQRLAQRGAQLPDNEDDATGLAVLRIITGQSELDEAIEHFDQNRRAVLELYVGYWHLLGGEADAGRALIHAAAQCPDPSKVPWEAAAARVLDARLQADDD